jgi:hypothetical protein
LIWTETNLTTWAVNSQKQSVVSRADEEFSANRKESVFEVFRRNANRLVVHPCFHGLSDKNLQETSGLPSSLLSFDDLMSGFVALHGLGLHLFPTFLMEASDPDSVDELFDRLHKIHPSYPLKTALISVDYYEASLERHRKRASEAGVYAKFAALSRWRDKIKTFYGVDYGQIPRPLAERLSSFPSPKQSVKKAPSYTPLLMMFKSLYRLEYRQEMLSILGSPAKTLVRENYNCDHIEESLLNRLRVDTKSFCKSCPEVLIVYGNHVSSLWEQSCIPIRKATLVDVVIRDNIVSFDLLLGEYVVPSTATTATLSSFRNRIRDYFGDTLLLSDSRKWCFLGELGLLGDSEFDENNDADSWERLLQLFGDMKLLQFTDEPNVFAQLVPSRPPNAPNAPGMSYIMREGDTLDFQMNYRILKFEALEDREKREQLLKSRTFLVKGGSATVTVHGYHPCPLPKYGDIRFRLRCNEVDFDRPQQIIIEAEDQSPFCPRFTVNLQLKKAKASE